MRDIYVYTYVYTRTRTRVFNIYVCIKLNWKIRKINCTCHGLRVSDINIRRNVIYDFNEFIVSQKNPLSVSFRS